MERYANNLLRTDRRVAFYHGHITGSFNLVYPPCPVVHTATSWLEHELKLVVQDLGWNLTREPQARHGRRSEELLRSRGSLMRQIELSSLAIGEIEVDAWACEAAGEACW